MLEEAGIVVVDGDTVSLADRWLEAVEEQRGLGRELEADEITRRRYEIKRQAYHRRHETPESKPSAAGLEAIRLSREKRAEHLKAQPPPKTEPPPPLSPLAVAIRDYLDRYPHQARQSPSWIGLTLWAYELYPGKPTPEETRAAIDELGGAAYLDAKLKEAKGAA
jgi:hypothetical protein